MIDADGQLKKWRMMRIGDIALVDIAADENGPRCVNVALERLEALDPGGTAFKLDPGRLVYSLRWKHNAHPPDFELVLIQDGPERVVNNANLTLLSELRRRAPEAIDWTKLAAAGMVDTLDAFEAARESGTARPH